VPPSSPECSSGSGPRPALTKGPRGVPAIVENGERVRAAAKRRSGRGEQHGRWAARRTNHDQLRRRSPSAGGAAPPPVSSREGRRSGVRRGGPPPQLDPRRRRRGTGKGRGGRRPHAKVGSRRPDQPRSAASRACVDLFGDERGWGRADDVGDRRVGRRSKPSRESRPRTCRHRKTATGPPGLQGSDEEAPPDDAERRSTGGRASQMSRTPPGHCRAESLATAET